MKFVLGNKTFREFLKKYLNSEKDEDCISAFEKKYSASKNSFSQSIQKCISSHEPLLIDEKLKDGSNIHIYIRMIAENPVTKVIALVIAILGIDMDT